VIIRGKTYTIYSLSLAGARRFVEAINLLLQNIRGQAALMLAANQAAPPQVLQNKRCRFFRKIAKMPIPEPVQRQALNLMDLFETILKDPLDLLRVASGLPAELFSPDNKDCLCLDEIIQIAEIIFEVNHLSFAWTALKKRVDQGLAKISTPMTMPVESLVQ